MATRRWQTIRPTPVRPTPVRTPTTPAPQTQNWAYGMGDVDRRMTAEQIAAQGAAGRAQYDALMAQQEARRRDMAAFMSGNGLPGQQSPANAYYSRLYGPTYNPSQQAINYAQLAANANRNMAPAWTSNPFVAGTPAMPLQTAINQPIKQYDPNSYKPIQFAGPVKYGTDQPAAPGELPAPIPYAPYEPTISPYPTNPNYIGGGQNNAYAWMSKLLNWNVNR